MYVAWFSVSNFVTARLLPYVMPFDQGVMQRSFDAGLYVMRLMHGSSTAVTCTLFQFQLRRLPKERHPSGRVHADADADGRSRRRQSTRRAILQATSLPLHMQVLGPMRVRCIPDVLAVARGLTAVLDRAALSLFVASP